MKRGLLLVSLLTLGISAGFAQKPTFEKLRTDLEKIYSRTLPDGSVKVSKQFRRWEWFWEPRQLPDGTLPSGAVYQNAINQLRTQKRSPEAQATPIWKEVGPTAPDLPGQSNIWNGIGRVNCMAFHPTNDATLWVGAAQGGLWKTTNGGLDWKQVMLGDFPQTGISDIGVSKSNPNLIYLATGDVDASMPGSLSSFPGFTYGVIKSEDGGQTWKATGLSYLPEQNVLVGRLWVDPKNDQVVIASTYDGIMKSTDGGVSWKLKANQGAFRDLVGINGSSVELIASTFNLNGGAAIYRTSDAGETWTLVQQLSLANRIRLAVTAANAKTVGAIASRASNNALEDVYYSNNGGTSFSKRNITINLLGWSPTGNDWQNGGQGFYDLALAIDPTNDNNWIMGGVNAWRSSNAGASWVLSSHWTGSAAPWVHADHHFQAYHPKLNRLYDCNDGGIARSTDKGVSWRDISNGLSIQQYYGLAVSEMDSRLTLAGAQDNGTAITTNGSTFLHVLDGDGMATAIDFGNSNLMYASQPYGSFYRSATGGSGWRMIATPSSRGEQGGGWVSPIIADPNFSNRLYIGYTNVHKSTDAGNSWQQISNLGVSAYLRKLAVAPTDGNYLFAAYTSSMFTSTDAGKTWKPVSGVSGFVQDIEVDPDNPKHYWICFGGFSPNAKVYEITDGKISNITGTGLPNVPVNAIEFQPGALNRLYIGTDVGVFFKDAGSNIWEPYGNNMPEVVVSGMELIQSADKLRISTYGRGIWEVDARQCLATTPTVTASGPTTFCSGDSVLLIASEGFDSYKWSDGSEGRTLLIKNISQSGVYTVSVIDSKECRATSLPIEVTVARTPGKPIVTLRGQDTLKATALGGITNYQWYVDGELISGATNRTYVATKTGKYTVKIVNADGCEAISDPYDFVETSVSETTTQHLLAIWPNPAGGVVRMSVPSESISSIEILDLNGRMLITKDVRGNEQPLTLDLNATGLANGTYVVVVSAASSKYTAILVKR